MTNLKSFLRNKGADNNKERTKETTVRRILTPERKNNKYTKNTQNLNLQ